MSRSAKSSRARAVGQLNRQASPFSVGQQATDEAQYPRQGGTVVQGLLSKSEQGLESQNKKHGEQGAPLQGCISSRHLGRWEQSVDLREKPGSALPPPPSQGIHASN